MKTKHTLLLPRQNALAFFTGRLFFLTSFVFIFCLSCNSGQVHYSDAIEILKDNFWINDNTLQIQVGYVNNDNIPYTMRQKASCKKAKKLIAGHLLSLYPGAKDLAYRTRIYRTWFPGYDECRLIVHISYPGLKEKVKQP